MAPLPRRNWTTPCTPEQRTLDATSGAGCPSVSGSGSSMGGHCGREDQLAECVCCGGSSSGAPSVDDTTEDLDAVPSCKRARRWRFSIAERISGPSMPVDTYAAVVQHGLPESLEAWAASQELYFGGHPVLPPGWIRCFSMTRLVAYYCRLEDRNTTFEWSKMSTTPAVAM